MLVGIKPEQSDDGPDGAERADGDEGAEGDDGTHQTSSSSKAAPSLAVVASPSSIVPSSSTLEIVDPRAKKTEDEETKGSRKQDARIGNFY